MPSVSPAWRAPLLAVACLLAYFALAYARGEDSYVRIDDHLDGNVPLYRFLSRTQPILGPLDYRIDAIFGGIPRNSMPTTLHLGALPYYLLDTFWAQVANEVLIRLATFAGVFLLLRRHLLPHASPFVHAGAALCFSLQPFMPIGYWSVAGAPLLLYALVNLHQGRGSPWDWGIVAVYPFYSALVYVGFFVLLLLGVLLLRDALRGRLDAALLAATALIAGGYCVSEYRLLYQTFLDPDYVSYRSEFVRAKGPLRHVVKAIVVTFFQNHVHAAGLQTPFIVSSMALAVGLGVRERARRPGGWSLRELGFELREGWAGRSVFGALLLLTLLCLVLAVYAGIWRWTPIQALVEGSPAPVRSFNFHRLQWFAAPLFALAFGCALHELDARLRHGRSLVVALLAAQLAWTVWNSDGWKEQRRSGLTYHGYYSPELFLEIRDHIGRPQSEYRVVSFGLSPAIALYNGFSVLDGIVQDYPLSHKRRFRRVMAPELEKDPGLREWYDGWGGHVDLVSSELGRVSGYARSVYTKRAERRAVDHLELDPDALRELGAAYLLSAVEIRDHPNLGLRLERVFERDDSPWQIFLYALEPR